MWPKLLDVLLRNLLKYSPYVILSILLLFAGNLARRYYLDAQKATAKYQELLGTTQDYNQLTKELASLRVVYANEKDLRTREEKDWASEKKNLQGQISALASASFSVPSFQNHQDAPDLVTSEYIKQEVNFHDSDHGAIGPPFGYAQLFNGTGKVIEGSYSASVDIKAAVSREANGRYHVLTKGTWTLTDPESLGHSHPELHKVDWVGKPWPLAISGGEFWIDPVAKIDAASKRKFIVAPHLNFGGYAGADPLLTMGLHGDVSVFGYGYTKNDLDFKLLSVGVNGSHDHFDANIVPLKWRIGNIIPLIDDVYVGAGVGIGYPPTPTYFLTLDTTL